MRRIVFVFVAAMIMSVLGVGVALADPINSKKATTFTVNCEGETFDVVESFGAGAVHILGDTSNFVVKEVTFTALDPTTGEVLASQTFAPAGKMVGLEGELRTCTRGPSRATDPVLGEIDIFVEARVLFTPRD
jgi:hypothetical protein